MFIKYDIEKYEYTPLPSELYIGKSSIHGQGVFTRDLLSIDTNLGACHYRIKNILLRSPLGGFINHSSIPNCRVKLESNVDGLNTYVLIVIRDIPPHAELTLDYSEGWQIVNGYDLDT